MKALLKNVTNYRTLTRKFIVKNGMSGNTPPAVKIMLKFSQISYRTTWN
jgi:hypothetical protein